MLHCTFLLCSIESCSYILVLRVEERQEGGGRGEGGGRREGGGGVGSGREETGGGEGEGLVVSGPCGFYTR